MGVGAYALSVAQYRAHVCALMEPTASTHVRLQDAYHQVLREDVFAAFDIPLFTNSGMDGFAFRSSDFAGQGPYSFEVVAEITAGTRTEYALLPGQSARIMTGAPLPRNADTVLPVEYVLESFVDTQRWPTFEPGERICVQHAAEPGKHVRIAGEDCATGTRLAQAGTKLNAAQIALFAAAGVEEVCVAQPVRVAIATTGDELVPVGVHPGYGQIVNSNEVFLEQVCREVGAEVVFSAHLNDTTAHGKPVNEAEELLERCQREQIDVLICSGGISAGAYDVVKQVFDGQLDFFQVAIQPGKPQGCGILGEKIRVVALPGNPVSTAVSFYAFVKPALLYAMSGTSCTPQTYQQHVGLPVYERIVVNDQWESPSCKEQYMPVVFIADEHGNLRLKRANANGGSGSHRLFTLGSAEGFAIVDAETTYVFPGDLLRVERVWSV